MYTCSYKQRCAESLIESLISSVQLEIHTSCLGICLFSYWHQPKDDLILKADLSKGNLK